MLQTNNEVTTLPRESRLLTLINYLENLKSPSDDDDENPSHNTKSSDESKTHSSVSLSDSPLSTASFLTFFFEMILQQDNKNIISSSLYMTLSL